MNSERMVIIAHAKPDGDTLGAAIALYLALKPLGKDIKLACIDKPDIRFSYLKDIHKFTQDFDCSSLDLICTMDHGEKSMMVYDKKYTEIQNNEIKLLNIDHHISNDGFGDVNLVDVNATSSTIVVYRLIKSLGLKVTPDIATALLGGIYTDTTSFFNLNTNYESLKVSSELLSYGANRKSVVKSLFQNHTIPQLKLWGRLLTKLHVNEKGFLVSYVTDKDFEKTNTTPEQVIGAIDLMNTVAGVKLSLLMNEDREGYIKGSLRTNEEDVDVNSIALKFGGGGHKRSAGFRIKGNLSGSNKIFIKSNNPDL